VINKYQRTRAPIGGAWSIQHQLQDGAAIGERARGRRAGAYASKVRITSGIGENVGAGFVQPARFKKRRSYRRRNYTAARR
jgi:hypothetical protein